jgi:hypothetical protein
LFSSSVKVGTLEGLFAAEAFGVSGEAGGDETLMGVEFLSGGGGGGIALRSRSALLSSFWISSSFTSSTTRIVGALLLVFRVRRASRRNHVRKDHDDGGCL